MKFIDSTLPDHIELWPGPDANGNPAWLCSLVRNGAFCGIVIGPTKRKAQAISEAYQLWGLPIVEVEEPLTRPVFEG
jgi:CO dehydrogenase/acetyl-CoA synthase alpha subunit